MAENKLTGEFEPQVAQPEVIPYLVKGKDAKQLYDLATQTIHEGLWFDESAQEVFGSTPFAAARINALVSPLGFRVANLRDLSRPEVMAVVKDKFYTDSPEFVVRSAKDSRGQNQAFLDQIVSLVEQKQGEARFPFKISGFDVAKDGQGSYGYKIVPTENFTVVEDERFEARYNGRKFNSVDEAGIPLFDKSGSRSWYARDNGLSRLYLNRNWDLCSNYEVLANSDGYGRVVLVRGEATREILNKSLGELQSAQAKQIAEIGERAEKAKRYLQTGKIE